MNPPKITRPAVPEVKHEFPAWYQDENGTVALFQDERNATVYDTFAKKFVNCMVLIESWERLPSGSKIEFTQP